MEEKIIQVEDNILNDDGTIKYVGYSKKPMLRYNKEAIRKKKRIKEWDYYYIADQTFGLCVTISDLSYASVLSASVVDFMHDKHYNKTSLALFPKEKPTMSRSSVDGTCAIKTKNAEFKFEVKKGKRHLKGYMKNFFKNEGNNPDLEFDIELKNEPEESMVKVTPFKNKNHFYYNHKINGITASGKFTFKGKKYAFDELSTLATFDFGRGVLPYKSHWYWASMSTRLENNKILGFNLGKAFGNNNDATENMIFYDGKAHKISDVKIHIKTRNGKTDYLGAWTFYSDDGRLELMFEPDIDRHAPFNALVVAFLPHQVFGKYSGKLVLDDGSSIELDRVPGFAERVENRW